MRVSLSHNRMTGDQATGSGHRADCHVDLARVRGRALAYSPRVRVFYSASDPVSGRVRWSTWRGHRITIALDRRSTFLETCPRQREGASMTMTVTMRDEVLRKGRIAAGAVG